MSHATFNQPPAPKRPVFKRKGFWIGVAVVVALGAAVNATDDSSSTDAKPKPAVTVTKTAAPDADKALQDVQDSNKQGQDDLQKEIDEAEKSVEAEEPAVVPNVVGMNHADAMTVLHTAGFMVDENSISPGNTFILNNSNWKVCSQDPAAGATDVLRVTVNSVKLSESC